MRAGSARAAQLWLGTLFHLTHAYIVHARVRTAMTVAGPCPTVAPIV
jgi:hypothetical protein